MTNNAYCRPSATDDLVLLLAGGITGVEPRHTHAADAPRAHSTTEFNPHRGSDLLSHAPNEGWDQILLRTLGHVLEPGITARQPEPGCVFCRIINGAEPAEVVRRWPMSIAIRPRHPVTDGHVLVIPTVHVADVATNRYVSAVTMAAAADLAVEHENCNVLTSRGRAATQSVFHLHLHVVPRAAGDGLPLPWTPQQATAREEEA